MVTYLDTHPDCGMVYTYMARIDGDGRELSAKRIPAHAGDIFPHLFQKSFIYPSMVMYRRQTVLEAGLFQERFSSRGEDCDFFLRIAQKTKIGVIREHLAKYRTHAENVSKGKLEITPFASEEIQLQYRDHLLDKYSHGWWYYRRKMSKVYQVQAKVYLAAESTNAGINRLMQSLVLYPFRLDVVRLFLSTVFSRLRSGLRD